MANKHNNLNELFTAIANAIRSKTGDTDKIIADNFPDEISTIWEIGYDDGYYAGLENSTDYVKGKTKGKEDGYYAGELDRQNGNYGGSIEHYYNPYTDENGNTTTEAYQWGYEAGYYDGYEEGFYDDFIEDGEEILPED